jgi:hypothetical protein
VAGRAGSQILRWALTAGVSAVVLGVGGAYGVPLAARAVVWGLRLTIDGVLWVALSLSTGTDVWTIAGAAGRAVTASLVTPQAIGGAGVLLAVSAAAFLGLRRLFGWGKESV